jgi:hypothetical protein
MAPARLTPAPRLANPETRGGPALVGVASRCATPCSRVRGGAPKIEQEGEGEGGEGGWVQKISRPPHTHAGQHLATSAHFAGLGLAGDSGACTSMRTGGPDIFTTTCVPHAASLAVTRRHVPGAQQSAGSLGRAVRRKRQVPLDQRVGRPGPSTVQHRQAKHP